jgi:Acyl-CoA dehydrogenase, middle domain/Acyl-CoA dehydrogenase, N-terminal domain
MTSELSRLGYSGVVWGLGGSNSIGFPPILNYGTEDLKDALCPGIINGSIRVCLGITEPQAGSDVAGIQTTAQKTQDGKYYIVNGQKKWYFSIFEFGLTEGSQTVFGAIMSPLLFGPVEQKVPPEGSQCLLFH